MTALRRALEDRLAAASGRSGIAINRLRKECAFQRLLARFVTVGGPWALKGGVSVLWRVDRRLRATADVDANWRSGVGELDDFLDRVTLCDLADGFVFAIGDATPLLGETEGGLRLPVTATMAGREFERFQLDVNLTPADTRPVEQLRLTTSPMDFAAVAVPHVTVPVIGLAQQLAEKLHASARIYGDGQVSSRPKDIFDTVAIARLVAVPGARELRAACETTFTLRGDALPLGPPELPGATWDGPLATLLDDCPLPIAESPAQLRQLFTTFWTTPLEPGIGRSDTSFDVETWSWTGSV